MSAEVNGCGPWFLGRAVPNGPEGRFRESCNAHDRAYNEGGAWADKRAADKALLAGCLASVQYAGPGLRLLGGCWALFYYFCVSLFGWVSFRRSKPTSSE